MTYLELFKKDHPQLAEPYIVEEFCPADKQVHMVCETVPDGIRADCTACWMRPADAEIAADGEVPDEDIAVAGPIYDPGIEGGPDR